MTPDIKPFLPPVIIRSNQVYERGECCASSSHRNEGIVIQAFMDETTDSNMSGLGDNAVSLHSRSVMLDAFSRLQFGGVIRSSRMKVIFDENSVIVSIGIQC